MRAVNLIPPDERRGAGGAAGRSGGAAYVLLAVLAGLVVVVALATHGKAANADKQARITALEAQAVQAEGRAAGLTSFTTFAGLRAARVQTVSSLAGSRFDWAHALGEVARVIPSNVSLLNLVGTVSPGIGLKSGAAGAAGQLRSALAVPALEITGCATDQDSVARMLTRMRLVDGVTRVSLQSSKKPDSAGSTPGSATGGVGNSTCRRGTPGKAPDFALVVFFDQVAGSVPTTAGGPAAQLTQTGATGASGATGATGTTGAAPIPAGATP